MLESFSNNPVTKIEGELTYKALRLLKSELMWNILLAMIELGGRSHSYLGLVLSPAKYDQITGHNSVPHSNLGSILTFLPNPTQPQIAQVNATHKD